MSHDITDWIADSDDFRSWVTAHCSCGETFSAAAGSDARRYINRKYAEHVRHMGEPVKSCRDCGKDRTFAWSSRFGELAPDEDYCGECLLGVSLGEVGL